LWASDGTSAGTTPLANFFNTIMRTATSLTGLGGVAYLVGLTEPWNYRLWRSNGTAAGTAQVSPATTISQAADPGGLAEAGGALYFVVSDPGNGPDKTGQLWQLVPDAPAPAAPVGLTATAASAAEVQLHWSQPSGGPASPGEAAGLP